MPTGTPEELVEYAINLAAEGDFGAAEELARGVLAEQDDLPIGSRLVAECAIKRKDYDQALRDLAEIDRKHDAHWMAALIMSADIYHNHVHRFRDAEHTYRQIIEIDSNSIFAHNGLARLLGLCGRQKDAVPHILKLIQLGQDTDLLILLSREGGLITDAQALSAARKADPEDPNPLLGMSHAAYANQDPETALEFLKEAEQMSGLPDDFHGRFGQLLLNLGKIEQLNNWLQATPNKTQSSASWEVLAALADRDGNNSAAIRCYWEVLKLHPQSLSALSQLVQKLNAVNEHELAKPFANRIEEINRLRDLQKVTIMSTEAPKYDDIWKLIRAYESVGRLWEAFAFGAMALETKPDHTALRKLVTSWASEMPGWPLQQTLPRLNPALNVDLSHFELPTEWQLRSSSMNENITSDIRFISQTAEIGFDFNYFNGSITPTKRLFEFGGGGVACFDFDQDGIPDLFCTQGRLWENDDASHQDTLYRNLDGQRFTSCSEQAGINENGFGQGVSTGDVNNDGFPDIYVANTHENQLWINNGDGTFSPGQEFSLSQWTTSCLIADMDGDSVPDLYDVNYLEADDLFDRTCTHKEGGQIMCTPYQFDPALDRLWLGNGKEGYADETSSQLLSPPNGKGLGVLAWNPSSGEKSQRGLSLFVSNDTVANFFYTPSDQGTWQDTALSSGLAYNGEGKAEACMGIACADCDQDGFLDLHITNYLYESNTLYRNVNGELFEDQTRSYQLKDKTLPVLGFGTQFLDANRDGRQELFVINGHIEDLSQFGTPFRMKPHFYEWSGHGFAELPTAQLGEWSKTEVVGRAVARCDWNLDHKPDLIVGLLDRPSFVLTNQSPAKNWLEIKLVGTASSRDAIGTTISLTCGTQKHVHQLTAGDGYQCSNQKTVFIGLGESTEVNELTINWPSGIQSQFKNLSANQSLILIENVPDPFELANEGFTSEN